MGTTVSKAFKSRRSQTVKPKSSASGAWNCKKAQPNVHQPYPGGFKTGDDMQYATQLNPNVVETGAVHTGTSGADQVSGKAPEPTSETTTKADRLDTGIANEAHVNGRNADALGAEKSVGPVTNSLRSRGAPGNVSSGDLTVDVRETAPDRPRTISASASNRDIYGLDAHNPHDYEAYDERAPQMPKTWKKGDNIGSGSFGNVFLGLNCETGELLAVKEVGVATEASKMQENIDQLEQEVGLLASLNHPNIVRYIGTLREDKALYIFLEYVPGGSIASLLARFGSFDESVIKLYVRQVLEGLEYLHAQRTVHRDIKGGNILVEKSGRIKLADFGMAKQMVENMSCTRSFKGSAFWMAPEVIRQRGHGVAADIWSIGCTVLEMATGKPPWSQCSTQVQAIFKIASSSELPAIPESLSPAASEFILLCLQRDPGARPTALSLLNHQFVSDVEGLAYAGDNGVTPGVDREMPGMVTNSTPGYAQASIDSPPSNRQTPSIFATPSSPNGDSENLRGTPMSASTSGRQDAASIGARQRISGDSRSHIGRGVHRDVHSVDTHRRSHSDWGSGRGELGSPMAGSVGSHGNMHREVRGERREDPEGKEEFALFPQRFKVQGLLGLPPLKLPAHTTPPAKSLPPLGSKMSRSPSTPSAQA